MTDVHPMQAIFNAGTPIETVHTMISSYLATGFAVAAVYAAGILRGRRGVLYRRGLLVGMVLGAVCTPLQIVTGDINARWVADNQPTKLAAMEGQFQTESGAPLGSAGFPALKEHGTIVVRSRSRAVCRSSPTGTPGRLFGASMLFRRRHARPPAGPRRLPGHGRDRLRAAGTGRVVLHLLWAPMLLAGGSAPGRPASLLRW